MRKIKYGMALLLLALCQQNAMYAQTKEGQPEIDGKMISGLSPSKSIGNALSPNLFDGSVNINIPIYSYSNEYGDFSTSFSYNTKGIKVDEVASVIGLHWNLNAGGSIQRVMKDIPDEIYYPYHQTAIYPSTPIYPMIGKFAQSHRNPIENFYDASGYRDLEHDDFVVSIGGYSFTFNLGANGYIFKHPSNNLKIDVLLNGQPIGVLPLDDGNGYNLTFVITDQNGTKYHFMPENQINFSFTKTVSGTECVTKSKYCTNWLIKKIEFPNAKSIRYSYKTPAASSESYIVTNNASALEGLYFGVQIGNSLIMQDYKDVKLLDTIYYPDNVKVCFKYFGDNVYRKRCDLELFPILDEVEIISGNQKMRYILDQEFKTSDPYNYTIPKGTDCNNLSNQIWDKSLYYRMFLKGIYMYGGAGTPGSAFVPYYEFHYNNLKLPKRLSGAKDFYGYYNGKNNNEENAIPWHNLLIPNIASYPSYGADRSYDAHYAAAYLLDTITNTLGGKIALTYEEHYLYHNSLPNLPNDLYGKFTPDGVRVSEVRHIEKFNPLANTVTTYDYEGGQTFIPGGYFHYPYVMDGNNTVERYLMMSNFITKHQLINGSNHGYSKVTATVRNGQNELLSKNEITFTNMSDATSNYQPRYLMVGQPSHFYQAPYADRQYLKDWEIGLPIESKEYDANGNIVSHTKSQYRFTLDTMSTLGNIENRKFLDISGCNSPSCIDPATIYRPYTGKAHLVKNISYSYVNNTQSIADSVEYEYDTKDNLKATITTNSKGQKIINKNIYQYDIFGMNMPINLGAPDYIEKIVGTERWLKPNAASDSVLLDAVINKYDFGSGRNNIKSIYALEVGEPVPASNYIILPPPGSNLNINDYHQIKTVYNGGTPINFKKATEIILQDQHSNPLEVELMSNGQFISKIWDTLTGKTLAEVSNAKYNEVAFAGFDQAFGDNQMFLEGSLHSNGNFSYPNYGIAYSGDTICGRYYKLGYIYNCKLTGTQNLSSGKEYIVAFWSRDGIPTVTAPGNMNVTMAEVFTKGNWKYYVGKFTPAVQGNVIINNPTTAYGNFIAIDEVRIYPSDAQMSTYTYAPLMGLKASASPLGYLTFYEYDGLGRPTLIRNQDGEVMEKKIYGIQNYEN